MSDTLSPKVRIKVNVTGIQFLASETKKRNVTLKGARAAGKILIAAARGAAPKRKGSGALKSAQGVRVAKGTKAGTTASFAVQGAKKKVDKMVTLPGRKKPVRVVPAFYDHLVQLGTKAHALGKGESLGRAATKRRGAIAKTAQTTGKKHPGTAANPYRKRAWEAVKDRAGDAAVQAMGKAVKAEIAKQSAKVFAAATGGK